jgi:hypothetical protein
MKLFHLLLIGTALLSLRCQKTPLLDNEEPLVCTEQFVTITLQITGPPPSDYYTLRLNTKDTLRSDFIYENYYPVVNDNLVNQLQRNQSEIFVFVGVRQDNPIFETFEIQSDGCHVIKIKGPETID